MTIIESAKTVIWKSLVFSGRASRTEFWKFVLFLLLIQIALIVVNSIIFGPAMSETLKVTKSFVTGDQNVQRVVNYRYTSGIFGVIAFFVFLVPILSAGTRRLHDIGRAGWHIVALLAVGLGIGYLASFLSASEVPFDKSLLPKELPKGFKAPETMPAVTNYWLFFIGWISTFGSMITSVVWLSKASQPTTNKYGPNPSEAAQ